MQRGFAIIRSRPIVPGGNTSPGHGAVISCSGAGWVRLILNSGGYVEVYAQPGVTAISDIHVRAVDTGAQFTPLATNVVVNVVDYQA